MLKEKVCQIIGDPDLSFKEKIVEVEKLIMLDALKRNNWIKVRAAKELKVTYRIFNYKYDNYRLEEYKKEEISV